MNHEAWLDHALDPAFVTPGYATGGGIANEVTQLLLTNNANVNTADNDGWTPLHYAALLGNKGMVELLLAHGADGNAKAKAGATPLSEAESEQRNVVADLLRQHGGTE